MWNTLDKIETRISDLNVKEMLKVHTYFENDKKLRPNIISPKNIEARFAEKYMNLKV